jgi:hypothetical protein
MSSVDGLSRKTFVSMSSIGYKAAPVRRLFFSLFFTCSSKRLQKAFSGALCVSTGAFMSTNIGRRSMMFSPLIWRAFSISERSLLT